MANVDNTNVMDNTIDDIVVNEEAVKDKVNNVVEFKRSNLSLVKFSIIPSNIIVDESNERLLVEIVFPDKITIKTKDWKDFKRNLLKVINNYALP